MVAVMGDVFSLEYNCHVPLYFEGQAVRTFVQTPKFNNIVHLHPVAHCNCTRRQENNEEEAH
jgi:hypothetical protein